MGGEYHYGADLVQKDLKGQVLWMQHLFARWVSIKERLKNGNLFIFLDYDGTLSPIVERPEEARLPGETRKLLDGLSGMPGCKVAVVSGRALEDLKKRVGLEGVIYVGNHGLELEGPKIKFREFLSKGYKQILQEIKHKLEESLSSFAGALIEDKGLSLSVHYRRSAKGDIPRIKTVFHETVIPHLIADKIHIKQGKMVLEIRPPVEWDKGKAVLWLLARQQFTSQEARVYPLYIGDDVTDEDAFKALKNRGLTVFVGKPLSSHARYYLHNTEEVSELLKRIINLGED